MQQITPLPSSTGKTAAAQKLFKAAALENINAWSPNISEHIEQASKLVAPVTNQSISISNAEALGYSWKTVHAGTTLPMSQPCHINGTPLCFSGIQTLTAFCPPFKILEVSDGLFAHVFGAPICITSNGSVVIDDASSNYNRLLYYYDFSISNMINSAVYIDGEAVVITDDIRPLNYSHWLLDWIPRLQFIGQKARQRNVYVITTPLVQQFQIDSLEMCGFDRSRIIQLDDYQMIRAKRLLAPADIKKIPHPAFKVAPWAKSFLRDAIGLTSMQSSSPRVQIEKLYVSRADASRRRVQNESELTSSLERLGYVSVTMQPFTLREQVQIFAGAKSIIGLHGAGLSNLIFCRPGTSIIEIFPERYGTPAFAALAGALDLKYSTFVAETLDPSNIPQYDDVYVDVDRIREHAGGQSSD